jgi:hypothetical protein
LALWILLGLPVAARLIFAGLLVSFLILEFGFKLQDFYLHLRYPKTPDLESISWSYDPLLGWKNAPGTDRIYSSPEFRIFSRVEINSRSLRDEETTYETPAGMRRILLLGDSIPAGFEVAREEVVDSLEDVLVLLRLAYYEGNGDMGSYLNFITGPSRTADIEQTLVIGVHGPREAHMVLLSSVES